jgi:hypothetical protein
VSKPPHQSSECWQLDTLLMQNASIAAVLNAAQQDVIGILTRQHNRIRPVHELEYDFAINAAFEPLQCT